MMYNLILTLCVFLHYIYWVGQKLHLGFPVILWSSPSTGFVEDNFSRDQGGREYGVGMIEVHSIYGILYFCWDSLMAQMVKKLPAMQETWVRSLGWEDALEKGMVTHSSILAWRIPWTEQPGTLYPIGSQRVGHDWVTNTHSLTYFSYYYISSTSDHQALGPGSWRTLL